MRLLDRLPLTDTFASLSAYQFSNFLQPKLLPSPQRADTITGDAVRVTAILQQQPRDLIVAAEYCPVRRGLAKFVEAAWVGAGFQKQFDSLSIASEHRLVERVIHGA